MAEIEVRLSQLRHAAESLYRSGRQIETSVQTVSDIIDELFLLGWDAPELQTRYLLYRGHMQNWAATVLYFAEKLSLTADDIERVQRDLNDTPRFGHVSHTHLHLQAAPAVSALPAVPSAPDVSALSVPAAITYVSAANQVVYARWHDLGQTLTERHAALNALLEQRQQTLSELNGLQNRLLSDDPHIDLNSVPRLQLLHAGIARFDVQIESANSEIAALQGDYDRLNARLGLVQPGAGANLELIRSLETAQTPDWIKQKTYDCVNYIVHRMPIPPGVAVDAHMWDEMAQNLPQYGIQMGDVPLPGSVVVMEREHSFADDTYGHLLYVERVEAGVVWVTDNYHPDEAVRLADLTREMRGQNIHYLYFPWHTRV